MRKGRMSTNECNCSCGKGCFFCKQCREVICQYCKSTKHGHDECPAVDTVAMEIQHNIRSYDVERTKRQKNDWVRRNQEIIKNMRNDMISRETKQIEELDERLANLHEELNKIHLKMVEKIRKTVKEDSEKLNEAERILKNTTNTITSLCDAAKKLIDEQNSIDVKEDYSILDNIKDVMQAKIEIPQKGDAFFLNFCPGTTEKVQLKSMFGKISRQEGSEHQRKQNSEVARQISCPGRSCWIGSRMDEITPLSSFRVDYGVYYVACTTDEKCWSGVVGSRDIRLMNREGREVNTRTLEQECRGLTTTQNGSLYIACDNSSLYKLLADDTMHCIQARLPFSPLGLAFLPDTGELFVCGGKSGVFSVTNEVVHPVLTEGKFDDAWDIAVNGGGDVCVCDAGLEEVFIFDSHGSLVSTYTGHADLERKMKPRGVTHDGRGGFIVADWNNRMLHVISRDGSNVMMYDTGEDCDGSPLFLDMSLSGRLWVCFDVGLEDRHICVYNTA